jgi:hypothetical protein
METKIGLLAVREEVWTRGDEHPDQEGDPSGQQMALEGNQEWAMVLASKPSGYASGTVAKQVWPDPGKPGEARFVLHDNREEKLLGLLKRSG